jgi:hypothetical protein
MPLKGSRGVGFSSGDFTRMQGSGKHIPLLKQALDRVRIGLKTYE